MTVIGDPDAPSATVLAAARDLAARQGGVAAGEVELVRTLSSTWLAMTGRIVVKVHAPGTTAADLAGRLALAAAEEVRGCVLAPLGTRPVALSAGAAPIWASVWPRVEPLPQDVEVAPWAAAGALLARLHRAGLPTGAATDAATGVATATATATGVEALPWQGSVQRLQRALDRLERALGSGALPPALAGAADVVRAAARRLPDACRRPDGGPGRPRVLVHGDWHLGQLGRLPATGPADAPGADRWRLIDVDDLGVGDPAWDLGRPAAFWAAGLMPDDDWLTFLESYRAAGGPAVPAAGADPWPALDAVARACVVLAAAGAVRRAVLGEARLEEADARMVEICAGLPDDR